MNLLIVSHSYVLSNARGKIRQLRTPLSLIVPREWPFEFLTATAEPEPDPDIHLYPVPAFFPGRVIRFYFAPLALRAVLRRIRPDIVLVEEEPNSLALAQFSIMKKRHSFQLFCFTWENLVRTPPLTRMVEKLNLRALDGLIAGTEGAADVVRKKDYEGPIFINPQMGVGPEFLPNGATRRDDLFVLGYVGRLVEEKGLKVLFRAIQDLPGSWELSIVGNGPLRDELKSMASDGGFGSRVRWIDFVPRHELPSLLRTFDALILPSISTGTWKEQFGRVLIEAMACGIPVVGSSSGAIPDVIGDAGLVFAESDSAELKVRIMDLMSDPDLRSTLSERGLRLVDTRYTDQVIAENLKRILLGQAF